ncbi:glutathione S-transferase N-terminal domain-containing protein [Elioraea sp.]|uniref:glutathione S-transferase N-terminal domain-containing protein n=1 Tax=Elioraea sp. TaxID=2185103 RepID=UPI0025C4467A|nr:glutathione S-transferase N-terminal domain-containing protein [Elioraea sp.]
MKLSYSPASPYVRKVMACAIARGIEGRIEKVPMNPHVSPAELLAMNPLSKVPALLGEDGVAYFDSPVICEYLDTIGDAAPLLPAAGPARLAALRQQAIGDGIMDAAVGRRGESQRPKEEARDGVMLRQTAAVARALDLIEREVDALSGPLTLGTLTVACALGYLDFRFAADAWRDGHPKLTTWYESVARHRALAETVPVG